MSDISFHRLEGYDESIRSATSKKYVRCSFETERFGYYQVDYDGKNFRELANEPNINMFTYEKRDEMEKICAIVYRMVYEVPAMKDRFA